MLGLKRKKLCERNLHILRIHLNTANSIPERFQVTNALDSLEPREAREMEKWRKTHTHTHTCARILRFNLEYIKRLAITHARISKAIKFAQEKARRR